MKKVFVSMMLAGALMTGGTIFAQSKADGNTGATTQKENCGNCPQGKACDKSKGQWKEKAPKYNAFEGVQLTPDQQQRLQVLRQGLGPVVLTPEQQAKIKENPNLTPAEKKQLKAERKAKKVEAKKNYLNGVKEILTPEQYVIFLENVYVYGPDPQTKVFKGKGQGKKDGKKGHNKKGHGDKKDKGQKEGKK